MAARPLLTAIRANGSRFVLPDPSSYKGISADLVDSGRNTEGFVIADLVRPDVAKVEIIWNVLYPDQFSEICKLFQAKYGGSFFTKFEFFNQTINDWQTRVFYPNDRTASIYSTAATLKPGRTDDGRPAWYSKVPLNLIER